MIAAPALAAAFVAWFAARARLGARARGVGSVRLGAVERAVANGAALRLGALGMLAGVVVAGASGGVTGALGGLASQRVLRARAAGGRARRLEEQLPDVLRSVAAAVRAGRSLPQALEVARDDAREPVRAALDAAVRRRAVGAPLPDALDAFVRAAGSPTATLIADTIRTSRRAGSNLPAILDAAVESLVERERIARDRRAATSQARLSAAVVGAMPLAFLVLVGPSARGQLADAVRDPLGLVALGAGLTLEAGGVLWMRALTRAT